MGLEGVDAVAIVGTLAAAAAGVWELMRFERRGVRVCIDACVRVWLKCWTRSELGLVESDHEAGGSASAKKVSQKAGAQLGSYQPKIVHTFSVISKLTCPTRFNMKN